MATKRMCGRAARISAQTSALSASREVAVAGARDLEPRGGARARLLERALEDVLARTEDEDAVALALGQARTADA